MKMNKAGANAAWSGLSAEAKETLEGWLFDEELNFPVALERAQKELGFTGSVSSLKRFYQRRSQERVLAGFGEAQSQAKGIAGAKGEAGLLCHAGMKVMAQLFLRQVTEAPEQVEKWGRLAKLLLQSEGNESWRRLKREENHLKRLALDFAREKFQYKALDAAYQMLPELKELERAKRDPNLTDFEYNKQTNLMRRRMFGWDLPDILPENEEEERVMKAEKARLEEEQEAHSQRVQEAYRRRLQAGEKGQGEP